MTAVLRRNAWVVGAALLCVAGCSPATRAKRAARRGDALLAEGQYGDAHRQYAKSLELHPTGNTAFKNAYTLNKLGERSASIENLAQSLELGMDGARLVLASYGGIPTDDLREYVRNNATDAFAWTALGERHFRSGDNHLATQCFETALANCDNAALGKTLTYNLSLAYLRRGRYPDAERAFNDFVARVGMPLKDNELLVLGSIRYAQGDIPGAATAWSKLPMQTRELIAAQLADESPAFAALATDQ